MVAIGEARRAARSGLQRAAEMAIENVADARGAIVAVVIVAVGGVLGLGVLHENGTGVAKNLPKAREWYEKSANARWQEGLYAFARYLDRGIGGTVDHHRAARFLLDAYRGGNVDAQRSVSERLTGWTSATIVELKRELRRLGHYTGPVNPVWDAEVKTAADKYAR